MFEGILGNESTKEVLTRLVRSRRVPQSLLFTGREGVGKRLFALRLAQAFVCTADDSTIPCGTCSACVRAVTFESARSEKREDHQQVIFSGHPDVGLLVPYNHTILIDAVRDLEREANFRPYESRRRVFIIDDAEKLSSVMDNAANALLKTLEEPPESTNIILISSRPLLLLSTIRSRCQSVRFGPVPKDEIIDLLTGSHGYPSEDAALVAGLSRGSVGRALGIDIGEFRELRKQMLSALRRCARRDDYAALLRAAEEISAPKSRELFGNCLTILQSLIHDAWSIRMRSEPRVVNFDIEKELRKLASMTESGRLARWLEDIEEMRENLNFNLNKKLAADSLLIGMASG